MKEKIVSDQISVLTHSDEMSERKFIKATFPLGRSFDQDALNSEMARISSGSKSQLERIKEAINFDYWDQCHDLVPKQKNAEGPVQPVLRAADDPIPKEDFQRSLYHKVARIEELVGEIASGQSEDAMKMLLDLSIAAGREFNEMKMREELFRYVSTGKRQRRGLDERREKTAGKMRDDTQRRLDAMLELIEKGYTKSAAAREVAKMKDGKTVEANLKLLQRSEKDKKTKKRRTSR